MAQICDMTSANTEGRFKHDRGTKRQMQERAGVTAGPVYSRHYGSAFHDDGRAGIGDVLVVVIEAG